MPWLTLAIVCLCFRPFTSDLLQAPLSTASDKGQKEQAGVISGHEAKPHSRPYMVSFQIAGHHKCGGALISVDWVLTVAHCFPNISVGPVTAVLGIHRLDSHYTRHQVVTIKGYFPHPEFEDFSKVNDIMLLQLSWSMQLNEHVAILKLPESGEEVVAGMICSVSGWGSLKYNGPTAVALQEITVKVLNTQTCNSSKYWNGEIDGTMMCLQGVNKDALPCQGDSGDPVVCTQGVIQGLISYSYTGCNDKFKPPVATAVSKYIEWIINIVGRL